MNSRTGKEVGNLPTVEGMDGVSFDALISEFTFSVDDNVGCFFLRTGDRVSRSGVVSSNRTEESTAKIWNSVAISTEEGELFCTAFLLR